MADRKRRQRAEQLGRHAEWIAALHLSLKGYTIVARREKFPVGEIDLIARKPGLIVFVEVKFRRHLDLALDATSDENWHRISSAAELWSARHRESQRLDWRFDLVAVTPWRLPTHFKDFWRA